MFYTTDKDGNILAAANFRFSNEAVETNKQILRGLDGKLHFEDDTELISIELLKVNKLSEINSAYNAATTTLVSTYPSTEVLTFDKQEQEAQAWQSDSSVSTPLIDALALGRGIDKAELVQRIIAKAEAFAVATGYLTGQRQKYEDQLEAATTAEEIEAIVPEYTMPETTTEKVKLSPYYDL